MIKSCALFTRLVAVYLIAIVFLSSGFARGGGGCFLPNTPITMANGKDRAIETIRVGDVVRAYQSDGHVVNAPVQAIFTHHVHAYFILTTPFAVLHVTGEHPFFVGHGQFKPVSALHKNDIIYALVGNQLTAQRITNSVEVQATTPVYNLQIAPPHTYFAAGIAVHNKGGGGGGGHGGGGSHSHGSGGGGDAPISSLIILGSVVLLIIMTNSGNAQKNLDYNFSRRAIARKSNKTVKLLEFIAKQDVNYQPDNLVKITRRVFLKLQRCWQARDYEPMMADLMPDLYQQHHVQLAGMRRNREINKIDGLKIKYIDLVNIRYPEKKEQREFTALITAVAQDYYIDERTQRYLRGDSSVQPFQEFWTFQLQSSGWKLRDIEQTRESDYLQEENYVEQFTDGQVEKIYQSAVDKLGPTGPDLSRPVIAKANRVERMLNFLVQSDKSWDKYAMQNRARVIFTNLHLALEAGKLTPDTKAQLFPAVAEEFNRAIITWNQWENTIEYRNFCVRKVEIVLVKNFNDKAANEFIALISAHAQRIHRQKGKIIQQDNDVTFFQELWTFGYLNGQWQLKDVSVKLEQEVINTENSDEGSSLDLVKWYYTKKRAI